MVLAVCPPGKVNTENLIVWSSAAVGGVSPIRSHRPISIVSQGILPAGVSSTATTGRRTYFPRRSSWPCPGWQSLYCKTSPGDQGHFHAQDGFRGVFFLGCLDRSCRYAFCKTVRRFWTSSGFQSSSNVVSSFSISAKALCFMVSDSLPYCHSVRAKAIHSALGGYSRHSRIVSDSAKVSPNKYSFS